MLELLEVRLNVERISLRRFLRNGSGGPAVTGRLHDAVQTMRHAASAQDRLAFCRADLAFHGGLVQLSDSLMLKPIWGSLSRGVLVFLMRERELAFDFAESVQDHTFLLDLLESGSELAVEREIERHIYSAARNYRQGRGPRMLQEKRSA